MRQRHEDHAKATLPKPKKINHLGIGLGTLLAILVVSCVLGGMNYYRHHTSGNTDGGQTQDYLSLPEAEQLINTKLPENASATDRALRYYLIANAYKETDKQKALYYLLEAEKQTPDDKNILYAIAELYHDLGDSAKQAEYEAKAGAKVQTEPPKAGCDTSEGRC
ncbi:hypothetical protein KC957_01785 [Candidatus Saccharibacteria bacterium]|nr:hypothetical protein [Candidatus Saccharibacteria bacterium]